MIADKPKRLRFLLDALEPLSLGISYAVLLAWVAFAVKQIGWTKTLGGIFARLFMAFMLGRFTAQRKEGDRLQKRLDELDSRSDRFESAVKQAIDLFQGQRLPEGLTCMHPHARCPSNCGKRCGHFYCPDCGLSWDDGAGK